MARRGAGSEQQWTNCLESMEALRANGYGRLCLEGLLKWTLKFVVLRLRLKAYHVHLFSIVDLHVLCYVLKFHLIKLGECDQKCRD